jgi:hypothetical protein
MKKLEKFAVVLIALWILQCIFAGLTPIWIKQIVASENIDRAIPDLEMLAASISIITGLGVSAACGIWLFLEAKREGHPHWLWCIMGLSFKINAVILFFVWLAFQEIRQMRMKTSLPDSPQS